MSDNSIENETKDSKKEINSDEAIEKTFANEKEYELKYIKFIIKDYTASPRTERAKILIYLLNKPCSISNLEKSFGYIIYGFNFEPVDKESFPENFDKSLIIKITNFTDICFYYLEYKLLFFLDLSQSMLLFDLRQKIFNIQKTEKYLKYLIKSCLQYEDYIYDFNLNKIKYKPKFICSIASSSNEEEIIIIQHAFILDEKYYNYHLDKITRKINLILSKYYEKKKKKEFENKNQILFLYKILENCLSTFNLMSSLGCPLLFLLTDGNACLPKLGKYNNILMQFNRVEISIQIIDLFYRNNIYGLISPTYANDIQTMKYLSQFTGGNYINENFFVTHFFPAEEMVNNNHSHLFPKNDNSCKNDVFFYPSLYPNILNFNSDLEYSHDLWLKRFYDYTEKLIHCEKCNKGFDIFLCKNILIKDKSEKEIIINEKMDVNNLFNKGLNIEAIGFLSNDISVVKKELFESYKITLSISIIIESRLRESFYLKKTKNPKKIKFILYFLPGIIIKYNLTKLNEDIFCEDYKVDIILKGDFPKINQMKKESYEKKKKSEKVELLLNFIKEIICTDKISSYFSDMLHREDFWDKDFFIKNQKYLIGLNVNKWHRFFNVMMNEIFIVDNTIKINRDFISNFLVSNEYALKKCEEKQQYLKNKIFKFCDDFNEQYNFGIKKISKEENTKGNLTHNGFMIIKFEWIYKNLCIFYLGFFHCFLIARTKYLQQFKEFLLKKEDNDAEKNLFIDIKEKHLTYFLTQHSEDMDTDNDEYRLKEINSSSNNNINILKKNVIGSKNFIERVKVYKGMRNKIYNLYSSIKEIEDFKNNGDSLFTYLVSQKLISKYLIQYQKVYEIPSTIENILRDFLECLLFQRLNENFQILDWNKNKMILFSYLPELNLGNNFSSSDIKSNPVFSSIIVLFSLEIIREEEKKLIATKLMLEPNENLFIFNKEEENNNIYEEKSYFTTIIEYFQKTDLKIKEKLKINV